MACGRAFCGYGLHSRNHPANIIIDNTAACTKKLICLGSSRPLVGPLRVDVLDRYAAHAIDEC